MALVVPPPPVEALRRSSRISLRRRLPTPVSSRNGIAPSPTRTHTALVDASTLRRDSYKPRSRVSAASPTASRHRAKNLSAAALPVRAGTKRKRLTSPPDLPDQPRYKLVVAEPHSDDEGQTPRQLRYAKRQRLLVAPSGIDTPTAAAEHAPSALYVRDDQENRSPVVEATPTTAAAIIPQPQVNLAQKAVCADNECPVFTPLHRRAIYWRHRTADSTEVTLWKAVCQERVEHLKTVYRDVFRAVVHAEAAAVQAGQARATAAAGALAPALSAGLSSSAPIGPSPVDCVLGSDISPQTQFELYTPSLYSSVDAAGDVSMDDGSSSEDDDDEDEDEDMDEDMDEEIPEVAYEQVLILDTPASPATSVPRLPRLSSIRVSSLEPHPPSSRDGLAFIGRGTPADPLRLADWAAPAPPLSPHSSSTSWSPEPLYFTPDMVPQPSAIGVSAIQPEFGLGGAMSWLDPALHADSVSPSPSPTPAAFPVAMPAFDASAFNGVSMPQPAFGGMSATSAALPSPTGCPLHESFLECLRAPGCAGPGLGASSFFPSPCPVFAQPAPTTDLTPTFAAPSAVFPNQELAQFVRSHLVPGSVTLSHALG